MGYSLKCDYFPMPHVLVDGGLLARLSPAECKLLLFLYAAINSRSAPCIRISLAQLAGLLHMDNKTIRTARRGLESKGLIRCGRAEKAGAPFELHVVNIETGEPFAPEDGRSEIAEYKPRKSKAAVTTTLQADSRAVRAARRPRTSAAESQPAQQAQQPQSGISMRKTHGTEEDLACVIHQNRAAYFDGDGTKHCQFCEPSRYAPPEETLSRRASKPPLRVCTQPTAEEIFGHK